jgi:tetratricopeptide (TPR) repeat protein
MGPDGNTNEGANGANGAGGAEEVGDGQLLREHLFDGDLLQLPRPDEGIPGFLPEWFTGTLPVLVYPPMSERGVQDGDTVNLEVTPYHLYYGALRELAETADAERSEMLHRTILFWNAEAAREVTQLAREQIQVDVETALLHYELAMELDDELYEAYQDGGMCEFALATLAPEDREERLGNADEYFRRAIELQPESGLSWWSLARVLNEQEAPDDAQAVLQQFLSEYPEGNEREMVEDALVNGFDSEMMAGGEMDGDDALELPDGAVDLSDDPAQAVEVLAPLAEQNPDDPRIWFTLGSAYRALEQGDEAERCLRRAARLAPEEPFIWLELSRACADLEQWRAAEEAIRKAIELDDQNALYFYDLGDILVERGDKDGAREALEAALALVPDDPEITAALERLGPAQA